MTPEELNNSLRHQPFQPFRIVLTDGAAYDVRYPELLWVGQRTAYVGPTGDAAQIFFEPSVKVDLLHVSRIEPLDPLANSKTNGSTT